MQVAFLSFFLLLVLVLWLPYASSGVIMSFALILAVLSLIVIIKRNLELKKHNLNIYDEDELIIQNVQKGGVIKIDCVDGQNEALELKVANRNLYMEGDYSWYELECINSNGEKFWIDIDDDDELIVSIVIEKPSASDLKFSTSLKDIDENEYGYVTYKKVRYHYLDSGDAIFYKYCNDRNKENLYYYDFRNGNYILSVEEWKNSTGKNDIEYYLSQIIKPSSITVYSTKGDKQ